MAFGPLYTSGRERLLARRALEQQGQTPDIRQIKQLALSTRNMPTGQSFGSSPQAPFQQGPFPQTPAQDRQLFTERTPSAFQMELQNILANRLAQKTQGLSQAMQGVSSGLTTLPENVAALPGFSGLSLSQARRLQDIEQSGLSSLYKGLSGVAEQRQTRLKQLAELGTKAFSEQQTIERDKEKSIQDRRLKTIEQYSDLRTDLMKEGVPLSEEAGQKFSQEILSSKNPEEVLGRYISTASQQPKVQQAFAPKAKAGTGVSLPSFPSISGETSASPLDQVFGSLAEYESAQKTIQGRAQLQKLRSQGITQKMIDEWATGKKQDLSTAIYDPEKRASLELKMANDFERFTQESKKALRSIGIMKTGYQEAIKAGFDERSLNAPSQAILVTFQRMLDPISVVRESEYARSGAGQSLDQRIEGTFNKLVYGGAGVTQKELGEFYRLSQELAKGYEANTKDYALRTQKQAQKYGLDIETILTPSTLDILKGGDKEQKQTFSGKTRKEAIKFLQDNNKPVTEKNIQFILSQ